jgi:pyruvate,orthophosphate dikinase
MMDTVLNLGLNDATVAAMAQAADPRFAWDSYRRFIQMYGSVVLDLDHHEFEAILELERERRGAALDTDMRAEDWQAVVGLYKGLVLEQLGTPFPQDPHDQLWGAIGAVFGSWMNARAIAYRQLHDIPAGWGTAVNVQAMVFGNMGETSATGVAFTRNPSTGAKELYGEFLVNAQGEDVVAGIRTPQDLTEAARIAAGIAGRRRWKRCCPRPSPSSPAPRRGSRATTVTCRIWSSPSNAASCGCCKRAAASEPPRRRCGSPWRWPPKA